MNTLLPLEPFSAKAALYAKPKRRRSQPEMSFQKAVVQLLAVALGGNAWFTSFPAGGGGYTRGARLKMSGLKPGVPDILIIDGGRCHWIELKTAKGSVSPVQKECHAALGRAGSPVAVVRSLDELMATLQKWGIALNPKVRELSGIGSRGERGAA